MREIKFRCFYDGKMWPCSVINNCYHPGDVVEIDFEKMEAEISLLPPETPVMQYTGLKDKNGKEIYEGDIVETFFENRKYVGAIEFSSQSLAYRMKEMEHVWLTGRTIKVIGNIYENPELLKN